uniref:Si:ch211-247i17.1 n=1 Tax=Fundulus heteroclitus TaxID=8078 RepID=A0A3Q2PYX8_FUNHE
MKTLILNSTTITLQLWDTAGQERYRSITEQYYRKADGILAMYDVTHAASFSAVRGWMDSAWFHECSAKTGYNMDELMVHLAMLVTKDDRQCEDAFLL